MTSDKAMLRRTSAWGVFAFGMLGIASFISALPTKEWVVRLRPNNENVVASELIGEWLSVKWLSTTLGGQSDHAGEGPIIFRENAVAQQRNIAFLSRTHEQLSQSALRADDRSMLEAIRTVYLAGEVSFMGEHYDFALISANGNPHLVFYDRKGDLEFENVMLARDIEEDDDILFMGGDMNNQSFGAYRRASAQLFPQHTVQVIADQ